MRILKTGLTLILVIYAFSCNKANEGLKVEQSLMPDGERIPRDGLNYYYDHKPLFQSLYAQNEELRKEKPLVAKLLKISPREYQDLKLNGKKLSLVFKDDRLRETEKEEDYDVRLNDSTIYSFTTKGPEPVNLVQSFFIRGNDWILEYFNNIVINGVNLNEKYGYEACFFPAIISGDLFYFARKNGKVLLMRNFKETRYSYDDVIVYQSGEASSYNPKFSRDILTFFAKEDKETFFVQAIVEKK